MICQGFLQRRTPLFDKNVRKAGFIHFGGPEGDRTLDLTDANRTLSQTELRAQINRSQKGTKEKYEVISLAEN